MIRRALARIFCFVGVHGGHWGAPIVLTGNKQWHGRELLSWQSATYQRKLYPACGHISQRLIGSGTPVGTPHPLS